VLAYAAIMGQKTEETLAQLIKQFGAPAYSLALQPVPDTYIDFYNGAEFGCEHVGRDVVVDGMQVLQANLPLLGGLSGKLIILCPACVARLHKVASGGITHFKSF
jgi:hypothetical protein